MTEDTTIDLLEKISEHSEFYASVCFTYGADLAFFEEAVLRSLWQNGCRYNLVFMDARRYADTTGALKASVTWVGQRYLLIPVDLGSFQSFHPKLVLLIGSQRGRLLVGSGNLTFTGFGHNHEVFTCLDWTPDNDRLHQLFAKSWHLINEVSRRWSYSAEAGKVLHKAAHVAAWLVARGEPSDDIELIHSLDEPLIDQCGRAIGGAPVDRITVLSPFLDQQGLALSSLHDHFQPQRLRLILQKGQAVGDVGSLKRLIESGVPLEVHRFVDEERYSHAKVCLFETSSASYALTGSPNCTRSAWLSTAADGNFEVALLRRSDSHRAFRSFIHDRFLTTSVATLDEVELRPQRLSPEADQSIAVRLLDVAVERGLLSVTLDILYLPEDVDRLQLRLATEPEHVIPLGTLKPGEHTLEVSVPSDIGALLRNPCSASVRGLTSEGQPSSVSSNELWVNNVDVLRREATRALPADARTGSYLAEMALGSEEEWRDLYNSLVRLVELEVAGLKQRAGTYTASPRKGRRSPEKSEGKETEVRIVTEEDRRREAEEIAATLFQESQLYTWLSHVRGGLPGAEGVGSDDVEKSSPVDQEVPEGRKEPTRRQPPPEQVGRSFRSLVKKYIRSLNNREYMQTASTYHIIAYYSVFQRMVGLLFQHEVISAARLLGFTTRINQGFFGGPGDPPPSLCPRLKRHVRRIWIEEWQEQEVPVYALVTALLADPGLSDLSAEPTSGDTSALVHRQTLRVLCAVLSVVGLPWIENLVSELSLVSDEAYGQDGDAFALEALKYINRHLSDLETILDDWTLKTSLGLANTDDVHTKDRLRQARMAYGFARYQVLARLQEAGEASGSAHKTLRRDLMSWMRAIDDAQSSRKWADTLVRTLEAEGKSRQVAKAIFQEGHKLFYDGYHEESASRFRQSLQLAERIGETSLMKKCRKYLSYAQFFLE